MSTIAIASANSNISSCAFCEGKVLKAQSFYEGAKASAIITYKPAVPGHVLIIPNRHVERFDQLTSEELVEMGEIIQKVDLAVRNLFGNTGYLLLQKNGAEAGQTVPHVHFHYLPRVEGDSHFLFTLRFFLSPYLSAMGPAEMAKLTADLRAEMLRAAL